MTNGILIVEDEVIIARALEQTVQNLGYKVCGLAARAETALKLTRELQPDLILMDIQLKGATDGIQVAAEIKRLYDIPVIYVTAFASPELLERAKITEPFGYVLKPVEPRTLEVAIAIGLYKHRLEKERAMLQEALCQAEKMAALGTLAGGLAHDFNNMLFAIMGFSELTLKSLPEGSQERWNLQQVLTAAARAKNLVSQIMVFCRKADQEKQPLHLDRLVQESLAEVRAAIPAAIEIKSRISAPAALVLADAVQLHQLILNLSSNAAQALREKGDTLEIDVAEICLDAAAALNYPDLAPGTYVTLTVRDNGPGIAPEIIDRIFEPFFTTREVGQGIGMGLAVVHGIVKSHGGAVSVSSRPGEGACFTVYLPKMNQSQDQEAQAAIPGGNGRILLVDDEKMLVEMTNRQLTALGYEVTPVTSSLEALELFRAQPGNFDLVLTDQKMPHLEGLQLARELRQIRPDIPIILCTGFSDQVSPETLTAVGIQALLPKPVELRNLAETVNKFLDQQKP